MPLSCNLMPENEKNINDIRLKFMDYDIKLFGIKNRGEIKEGNIADLTIYKLNQKFTIKDEWIESNCGWTPFNGTNIDVSPSGTVISGKIVVWNQELVLKSSGQPYSFN